jgi:hypothetical protein
MRLRQRLHLCGASICLTAALGAPAVIIAAAPAPQEDRGIYDRQHKDYHHWDDHEKDAWGRFLAEKHRKDHDFTSAKKHEQQEYWAWRHNHPD